MRKLFLFSLSLFALTAMAQNSSFIDAKQFAEMLSAKAAVIDLRSPEVYMYDHIADARCIPADDPNFEKRIKSISKKKPVLLYGDDDNAQAEKAAERFAAKGYQTHILQGGANAWTEAGYEMFQFRDTAELYGYADGFGFNPNLTGRLTLHLGEKYALLNIGSKNIFFNLKPENLIYANEKNGETNLIFRNPEEHYKYVRIEMSVRHIHLITTSLQTGEETDYCFTMERE